MPGLSLVGLLFLAARLDSFGLPKLAKKLVTIMAICAGGVLCAIAGSLVNVHLAVLFMITSFSLYLALWIWGAALMLRLRRSLRVDANEWWLDVEALPRVEWTWYARLGDHGSSSSMPVVERAGSRTTPTRFSGSTGPGFVRKIRRWLGD